MPYKWINQAARISSRYAVRLGKLYRLAAQEGVGSVKLAHHINWGSDGSFEVVRKPGLNDKETGKLMPRPAQPEVNGHHPQSPIDLFQKMEF